MARAARALRGVEGVGIKKKEQTHTHILVCKQAFPAAPE